MVPIGIHSIIPVRIAENVRDVLHIIRACIFILETRLVYSIERTSLTEILKTYVCFQEPIWQTMIQIILKCVRIMSNSV